jgi:hypothetical protein
MKKSVTILLFQTSSSLLKMSKELKFIFLLCFVAFKIAMNFTVDASLKSISGTSYPSLAQAFSALVNRWTGYLYNSSNTITLTPKKKGSIKKETDNKNQRRDPISSKCVP